MLYGGSLLYHVPIYATQSQFCNVQSYQLFMGLGKVVLYSNFTICLCNAFQWTEAYINTKLLWRLRRRERCLQLCWTCGTGSMLKQWKHLLCIASKIKEIPFYVFLSSIIQLPFSWNSVEEKLHHFDISVQSSCFWGHCSWQHGNVGTFFEDGTFNNIGSCSLK